MTGLIGMPVDNGCRLRIVSKFFTGVAGVRGDDAGGEIAFPGALPPRMPDLAGSVDGRPMTITSIRKSDTVPGMMVASFVYDGGDAA